MLIEGKGYEYDGVAVMARGDLLMAVWRAAGERERLRWAFERTDEFAQTHPSFIILNVVLPSSDPPDAKGRTETSARFKGYGDRLRRLVTVALGDSFRQSVVRTIMRAFAVISGTSKIYVVAATVDEAIRELLKTGTTETPDATQIRRDVNELLRLVGEEYQSASSRV